MIRDIGTVFKGTVVAQVVGVLTLPILSRLFAPSDFGHYAIYQAALLILIVVGCLRYEQAILTAQTDDEALDLFGLCIAVAVATTLVGLPIVALLYWSGLAAHWPTGFGLWWFLPAMFVSVAALASSALLTRLGAFKPSAAARMVQAGVNGGVSIASGAGGAQVGGLIVGDLIGKSGAVAFSLLRLGGSARRRLRALRYGQLRDLAIKFKRFPRLSVVGGLLNNGGTFITPTMIFAIYGANVAGQYSLVDRAISLPLSLVIIAVSQVFSSHYARLLRENPPSAVPYFRKLVFYSAALSAVPGVLGFVIAPYLFTMIFGEQWEMAGSFARILAIMYFSSAIMGPINTALVVKNKLNWQLFWEAGRFVVLVILWGAISVFHWPVEAALLSYSLAVAAVNMWYIWMAYSQLKKMTAASIAPYPQILES